MDLLQRLKSTPMVKTSRDMTPAKIECLDHMATNGKLVIKRTKGEDLPAVWHVVWELVDTGHVKEMPGRTEGGVREYGFEITDVGYTELRRNNRHNRG